MSTAPASCLLGSAAPSPTVSQHPAQLLAPPQSIGWLGTGLMGQPMVRRLLAAGFEVHVWNRTRAKADALAACGATVHAHAADAVRGRSAVIAMLEHAAAVEHVLFEAVDTQPHGATAQAMTPGTLFIDMASIQPSEARSHAERLACLGIRHIDAPVSGGTTGAETGSLVIMAGGDSADVQAATAVFAALGRVTHVGPHGSGQLAKLANQMIVGATIGAVAEALLFAAKGGADIAKVRDAITGGFADSRILHLHGERMVQRDFAPRGRVAVQLKDLRNALATANEIGFQAPVSTLLEALYADAARNGWAELDHSALFLELARRNDL